MRFRTILRLPAKINETMFEKKKNNSFESKNNKFDDNKDENKNSNYYYCPHLIETSNCSNHCRQYRWKMIGETNEEDIIDSNGNIYNDNDNVNNYINNGNTAATTTKNKDKYMNNENKHSNNRCILFNKDAVCGFGSKRIVSLCVRRFVRGGGVSEGGVSEGGGGGDGSKNVIVHGRYCVENMKEYDLKTVNDEKNHLNEENKVHDNNRSKNKQDNMNNRNKNNNNNNNNKNENDSNNKYYAKVGHRFKSSLNTIEEICHIDCPRDCVVSTWSVWQPCSSQCGFSYKKRTRSIVFPEQNGGRKCLEKDLVEYMPCSFVECYMWFSSEWGRCEVEVGVFFSFVYMFIHLIFSFDYSIFSICFIYLFVLVLGNAYKKKLHNFVQ